MREKKSQIVKEGLIGIYMFAKEITTKPDYNVKMISSDDPFSYLKS